MQQTLRIKDISDIEFIPHKHVANRADHYICVAVNPEKIIEKWQESILAFEWLDPNGQIKSLDDLPFAQRQKYQDTLQKINDNKPLENPILGLGLRGGIEIGSGKAVFLTLAHHGFISIPVHILRSDEHDFEAFLA